MDKGHHRLRSSVGALFLISAVVCTGGALVIGLVFDPDKDTLTFELWKLAIQALLIGALGSLLTAAIQENRSKREERATLRDFQRDQLTAALDDLALEYRLVKRSRRLLRLERPASWKLYHKELGRIEDLQRSLEDSQGTLEVLAATTSLQLAGAIKDVARMIECLDVLWKEREGVDAENFNAVELTELQRFIEPFGNDSNSFRPLKQSYKSARTQVLKLLAGLSGATMGPAN